jgi:hypothetical protein
MHFCEAIGRAAPHPPLPRSAACQRGEAANVDSDLVAASPHQFWTVRACERGRSPARASVLRICGVPGLLIAAMGFIMLPGLHDDPDRWFECASEMRALASAIKDPSGRSVALLVAKDLDWFEWLALQKAPPEKS